MHDVSGKLTPSISADAVLHGVVQQVGGHGERQTPVPDDVA